MKTEEPIDNQTMQAAEGQPIVLLYGPETADSVDLIEVASTLWRGKWRVVLVAALFLALSGLYVLLTAPKFEAEVLLSPNTSTAGSSLSASLGSLGSLAGIAGISLGPRSAETTNAIAIMNSRIFIEEYIRDENLLPQLFSDEWNSKDEKWKDSNSSEQPTVEDGVVLFQEKIRRISVDDSTGLVTLTIRWTEPEAAAAWATDFVERINDRMRSRVLSDSEQRLEYLNQELENARLVELRQVISQLVQEEIQTISLARAEPEFAFKIIDPARVPIEPVFPSRAMLMAIAAILGVFVGMFIVIMSAALAQTR